MHKNFSLGPAFFYVKLLQSYREACYMLGPLQNHIWNRLIWVLVLARGFQMKIRLCHLKNWLQTTYKSYQIKSWKTIQGWNCCLTSELPTITYLFILEWEYTKLLGLCTRQLSGLHINKSSVCCQKHIFHINQIVPRPRCCLRFIRRL